MQNLPHKRKLRKRPGRNRSQDLKTLIMTLWPPHMGRMEGKVCELGGCGIRRLGLGLGWAGEKQGPGDYTLERNG